MHHPQGVPNAMITALKTIQNNSGEQASPYCVRCVTATLY